MGVISFQEEFTIPVSPHRMFHALFVHAHNLMPKIMPHGVKSGGGPGSFQQVNFADGSPVKYMKNRLDLKDKDNLVWKYTVIECDVFGDKVEFKFETGPDGGCIFKTKSSYQPKGDTVLKEEKIEVGKEKSKGMFKFIEAYLVEDPHVYA
ncbi:Bet v I domain [Macleaya cordata]|uniref:Bet v I domain n=1 Tax=Macleaya cordata TaxID=56857 RepID=A0A200QAH9_MACCD|nr:Bet v I domain [Macleaya cordata]